MKRWLTPMLVAGLLLTASAALAQTGGPGNIAPPDGVAMSSGPTLGDLIQRTHSDIDAARSAHAISEAQARKSEAALRAIEKQEERLSSRVAKIRRSIPQAN